MWTVKTVQEIPTNPKLMGIYQITNIVNGKRYIGKSKDIRRRWTIHVQLLRRKEGTNAKLQHAWTKYGEDSFTFQILEIVEDEAELAAREKCLVESHSPEYNLAVILDASWNFTYEVRKKMRDAKLGKPASISKEALAERNRKISEANRGRKRTGSELERIRSYRASDSTKQKLSLAMKGKKLSDKTKQKLSQIGKETNAIRFLMTPEAVAKSLETRRKKVKTMKKWIVYTAGGWFSPKQAEEQTKIEEICDARSEWIDMKSPRRIFVCPPNASKEVQEATYQGNLKHIQDCDFLIANTRDKDMGTIMECGYATALKKPIVYFCQGLTGTFNLMLSRSGIKVCTTFEQLEDYLDRCKAAGEMLYEPYDKEIE